MPDISNKISKKINFKKIAVPLVLLALGLSLVFGDFSGTGIAAQNEKEAIEERLCSMINDLDGISEADVMILLDGEGNVSGAAVICCGGDLPQNQKSIIDMITSLFDIRSVDVFVGGK